MSSICIALLLLGNAAYALNNGNYPTPQLYGILRVNDVIGVGKLPTMGYDTYNAFEGDFDGELALEQARLMHEYGLVAAGYNVSMHNKLDISLHTY